MALDWLRQLLGLAPGWFGMITDTASISTLLALAAAREALPHLAIRSRGLAGRADLPPLRIYTSAESHSSVDRAAITLGFGHDNVVHVPVDHGYRMRPDALADLIAQDRARGYIPVAAVATVGTTGSGSIDPVPAIFRNGSRARVTLPWRFASSASALRPMKRCSGLWSGPACRHRPRRRRR